LRRVAAVLAVLGGLVALAPATRAAEVPRTRLCWTAQRPYPFPYTGVAFLHSRARNGVPGCRQAARGTPDFTPPGGFTAYSSVRAFEFGFLGSLGPAFSVQLRPPHPQPPDAPRTWPLRDSLGHIFALLTQQPIPDSLRDRWTISYPNGLVYGQSAAAGMRLLVQGRACMANDRLEDQNVMVVLFGGNYGFGPFAFGTQLFPGPVFMGIRGFLPLRALPTHGLAKPNGPLRGASTQALVEHFNTGCNLRDTTTFPAPSPPEAKAHGSLVPLFDWNDTYSGSGVGAGAGSRLTNYHGWPDPKQGLPGPVGPPPAHTTGRPDIVREVKLMQSTTAVDGGGIVRAIVPADSPFVELDHFTYRDPDVLCVRVGHRRVQATRVVRWIYVRVLHTRIEGWVPFRDTPQVISCPAGAAGKPPPH
jgi:hypothetical protein